MSALRLRVVIPHFFQEGSSDDSGGYGSGRRGNRIPRSFAFARCLGSVLSLNRAPRDWILNIAELQLERTATSQISGLPSVHVEVNVFVTGSSWISEVLEVFAPRIRVHLVELEDPLQLPLAAVRWLLDCSDQSDLSLYLEDDLVIQDTHYVDKLSWFYELVDHRYILMPNRREYSVANAPESLFVDGPIKPIDQVEPVWADDELVREKLQYRDGQEIHFSEVANPHSGSFCISRPQLEQLRTASWPPNTFIGPLETAATGVVRDHFRVLKPSISCREFLTLEHANPSFLETLTTLPQRVINP